MAKEEKPKCKVVISNNGPYIVSGNVPLGKDNVVRDKDDGEPFKWKRGEKLKGQETYALCRCGKSTNKPFCDGTHLSIDFSDESMSK